MDREEITVEEARAFRPAMPGPVARREGLTPTGAAI